MKTTTESGHPRSMAADSTDLDNTVLFHQLDAYPWHEDEEFLGGLRAILGPVQDPQQVQHLTLRAKCYYFSRKAGAPVDFNGYKNWVEGGHGVATDTLAQNGDEALQNKATVASNAEDGGMGDAPKPASFAEICEMIAEGKPIPGIKDIPDTVLEGQASQSQAESRKKPWESRPAQELEEKPSWMA